MNFGALFGSLLTATRLEVDKTLDVLLIIGDICFKMLEINHSLQILYE